MAISLAAYNPCYREHAAAVAYTCDTAVWSDHYDLNDKFNMASQRDYDLRGNVGRALVGWEIEWAGFRAYAHDLQRRGWEFTSYRDSRTFASVIVIENKSQRICLQGFVDDYEWKHKPQAGWLQVGLKHAAHDIVINTNVPLQATALDMSPMESVEYFRLLHSQSSPFKSLITNQEKRIIIPPEPSVDELLAKIIERQQPAQVEYFNKKIKENQMPEATLSAQIIQLRKAA